MILKAQHQILCTIDLIFLRFTVSLRYNANILFLLYPLPVTYISHGLMCPLPGGVSGWDVIVGGRGGWGIGGREYSWWEVVFQLSFPYYSHRVQRYVCKIGRLFRVSCSEHRKAFLCLKQAKSNCAKHLFIISLTKFHMWRKKWQN